MMNLIKLHTQTLIFTLEFLPQKHNFFHFTERHTQKSACSYQRPLTPSQFFDVGRTFGCRRRSTRPNIGPYIGQSPRGFNDIYVYSAQQSDGFEKKY